MPQGLAGTFRSYFDKVFRNLSQQHHSIPGGDGERHHEARLKQLLGLLAVSCEPPSLGQLASWMGPSSAPALSPSDPPSVVRREVEDLLLVLGSLFVIREEDGKVRGFHKSIYDWLLNAKVSHF